MPIRTDPWPAGTPCWTDLAVPDVDAALDAVAAEGDKLFVAGNLHTAAVTLFSTLLASDDGGHTWREAADRIQFAGIDRLQFLDADTGWASGEKLSPLPQEPFLLLTTDGGKTWRTRPISISRRVITGL